MLININGYCLNIVLDCINFPKNIGKATVVNVKYSQPMVVSVENIENTFAISVLNEGQLPSLKKGKTVIYPTLLQAQQIVNYLNNRVYDEFASLLFDPLMAKVNAYTNLS